MITKEKHFTKCETANSSCIIEDKKAAVKPLNGIVDPLKDMKRQTEISVKNEKTEEKTVAEVKTIINDVDKNKEGSSDDSNASNTPKFGTVIPNRIFVGGFSGKIGDEDLWRFFSTFAHIIAAKIIYDRAGVSKCYGFVTFTNSKDAKAIVKQTGGVMYSPMGRLRIAQAVRKQIPQYSTLPPDFPQMGSPGVPEGYYSPHACPPKPPVCIAYPIPPQIQPGMVQQSSSPHGSTAASSDSGMPHQHGIPQQQSQQQPQTVCVVTSQGQPITQTTQTNQGPPQSAPSAYAQAGPPDPPVYPTMMATPHPAYVVPYATAMPTYDATGLYTTCPGYAQPVPAAYPYAVMLPAPPRDSYPYHGSIVSYGPAPTACYPPDTHPKLPIMNSYIY